MLEAITDFLARQFADFGYLIVFVSAFIENSAFIGLALPGDTILVLSGFYSQGTDIKLPWLIILAILGAVLGDSTAYLFGRYGGRPLVRKLERRFGFLRKRMAQSQKYFKSYGGKTVLTGRFVAFVRTFVPFTAGVGRMPYLKFLLYNFIGASIQITTLILLGYFFGSQWKMIEGYLGKAGVLLLGVLIIVGVVIYRRRRKLPAKRT